MKRAQRLLGFLAAVCWLAAAPNARAVEIAISCSSLGQEYELCKHGVEAWEKISGHSVTLITTPNSATERLALYQQLLAAGADDIDVFQIDVIWPGILGAHFIDLALYSNRAEADHFPAIVGNNTVDGRLVAMPWFTDAGLLYFRKDLLDKHGADVPATWRALDRTAEAIQRKERALGNEKMWGFVWQGRAYEGLTCNALEWVTSHGGGEIVGAGGEITVDNANAAEAIRLAASWVGRVSPPGVLSYAEEEARGVFQSGNAVFMRNWPYAWSLANGDDSPVRGKVGVAVLPKGGANGRHAATLGGAQLAVSRYSRHPEVAADLVLFLTGAQEQKRRAVEGSYNPTIAALYEDADVLGANPFFGALRSVFVNAVARPSRVTGARYNQVSSAFWNAVHSVLSAKTPAGESLANLERQLERMSRRGKW